MSNFKQTFQNNLISRIAFFAFVFFIFSLYQIPKTSAAQIPLGTFSINPIATYLLQSQNPPDNCGPVSSSTPCDMTPKFIDLQSLGLKPGDQISIYGGGALCYYAVSNCSMQPPILLGVFDADSTLLPSTILNRLPGAISSNLPATTTPPAFYGNVPTDISQDFSVPNGSQNAVIATIPAGAKFLVVAQEDSYYGDNSGSEFVTLAKIVNPPVITLVGANPLQLTQGQTFVDPGATALDPQDGDITSKIVASSTVNTNLPGAYTVTYTVMDSLGLSAAPVVRTVNVSNNPGSLTCLQNNLIVDGGFEYPIIAPGTFSIISTTTTTNFPWNSSETAYGLEIQSGISGWLPFDGVQYAEIDGGLAHEVFQNIPTVPGTIYSLSFETSYRPDSALSVASMNVLIGGILKDTINAPQLASTTPANQTEWHAHVYTFTATTTSTRISFIDNKPMLPYRNELGTGTLLDTIRVCATGSVVNKPPVITLVGQNPASVIVGQTYVDAGATALDPQDGDITSRIIATSTVNTNVVGTYTVTYNVTDLEGLSASPVLRTVNVLNPGGGNPNGSVTFCMILANNNNIIATTSSNLPGSIFSINLATSTNFASTTIQTKIWNTSTFLPNAKTILSVNDSDCVTYSNLNFGTYYYSPVSGFSFLWNTPKYDDQENQSINNVFDFFPYASTSPNSDGIITLSSSHTARTVVVYDTYNPPVVCTGSCVATTSDISISKTVDKTTANVLDNLTYTITAKNNGSADATNVSITDILPSSLSFVSASSTLGNYATSTGIWNIGNLANGSSTTLTIVANVNSGSGGQIIANTATATSSQADPNPLNNTAIATTTVNNSGCTSNCGGGGTGADISVLKTVDKATANVLDTLTYTINVKDNGPQDATNVNVLDNLPSTLTFVSATSTLGTYATSTGLWIIPNLTNGSSSVLTLVAIVNVGTGNSTISNTATATSTQSDPNPTNNTSTINTNINGPGSPGCTLNCGGGGCSGNCGGGGGNGPIVSNLTISNEQALETVPGIAMVTWNTNLPATRRVVYDTVSHPTLGTDANYGYPNTTATVSTPLLTAHAMAIAINPNTTYYFREVSTASSTTSLGATMTAVGKETTVTAGTGISTGSCYYLHDYLRKDFNNNPIEVKKLQVFLHDLEGFSTLQITGVYDDATIAAVDAFQVRYTNDILIPWGYGGTQGTDYTYILTKKKVNEIYCQRAFPVTSQQQSEIDATRAFFESLRNEGINLNSQNTTEPRVDNNNNKTPLENNVVGQNSTSSTLAYSSTTLSAGQTTLAGLSTTTNGIVSAMTANIISAGKGLGSLLFFSNWPFARNSVLNSLCRPTFSGWLNLILIIIILIILYLWYREYRNGRTIEDINKEIDLK